MSASDVATFRILGLWLHLLAIVAWAGGMLGWGFVLATVEFPDGADGGSSWLEVLGRRVCVLGWEALFVLLLTGIFNLLPRVESGLLFEPSYRNPLLIKLGLVGAMAGLQLWQHGWLVPRLGTEARDRDEWSRLRRSILTAAGGIVVLAAVALWMGVRLRL